MKKRVSIFVNGLVQGVFFRASARREANRLGLFGMARNLPDGGVRIDAEGEEGSLVQLADWCRRGPRGARVEGVQIEWAGDLVGWSEFKVE